MIPGATGAQTVYDYWLGMMPQFFARQHIEPGSIHESIIKDKMKEDAIKKIVVGILVAIAAIALTVISLGTATPALVAAGAAAGAFGISAYQAFEEYKEYTQDQKLADAVPLDATPKTLRASLLRIESAARRALPVSVLTEEGVRVATDVFKSAINRTKSASSLSASIAIRTV